MGITRNEIRTVVRVCHNLPAVVLQPVVSPGCSVAPSNLYLFIPLKKHLGGKQFAINTDLKQGVTCCLQTLGTDFCCTGIQTLVPWYKQTSVVPTLRSGVYHLLHIFIQYSEVRINLPAAECLLLFPVNFLAIQYPPQQIPKCMCHPFNPPPTHHVDVWRCVCKLLKKGFL
jgi:hypothetical protein